MADKGITGNARPGRRGPSTLAELVSKAIAPLVAPRGFAATDLVAAWPGIAGARFADCTKPDRIVWPKGPANEGKSALLIVRVDGPRAVLFQHEVGQVIERVNAFFGYAAIGRVRIVQGPVKPAADDTAPAPAPLSPETEARLAETLTAVEDDSLRAALGRLGRGVLGETGR